MDKKTPRPTFKFPDVQRELVTLEAVKYSYLLKELGVSQELKFGDKYWALDDGSDSNSYKLFIYTELEVSDYDSFELQASRKYVRVIGIDEAMNLLRVMGFDFAFEEPIFTNMYGDVTVKIQSAAHGVNFEASTLGFHAALLKATYLAANYIKNVNDGHDKCANEGFFGEGPVV